MKKLNLLTKTLFLFSLLLFCAILFSGIFSILTFYKIIKTSEAYSLEKHATLISHILENKPLNEIINLTKSATKNEALRLTLIESSGNVLVDSNEDPNIMENHLTRPEIMQSLKNKTGISIRYSETIKEFMVYAAASFKAKNNTTLIIRISASLPNLKIQFHSFIAILIAVFVFIFIITVAISFYINSIMLKSIRTLTDAGKQWAKGELFYRVPELKDASFGELALTMNSMAEDIQTMLARLEKLETMRRDFVANVSHELRTPITLIKGFTETILNDIPGKNTQQKEFLNIMNKNADRMELIIRDLLTLSTLENSNTMQKEFIPIEAKFIVETCISLFREKAKRKDITINARTQNEIYALGNAGLLETALSNLIDNAVKYAPKSTEIFVSSFEKENQIYFTVKNSGNRIPEEHLARIFERFYRVDKARSKAVGGTGLGLAIVKHISIGHRGSCSVESNDEYTLFTLKIPAFQDPDF